jgi:hypothetical protein
MPVRKPPRAVMSPGPLSPEDWPESIEMASEEGSTTRTSGPAVTVTVTRGLGVSVGASVGLALTVAVTVVAGSVVESLGDWDKYVDQTVNRAATRVVRPPTTAATIRPARPGRRVADLPFAMPPDANGVRGVCFVRDQLVMRSRPASTHHVFPVMRS